MRVYDQYVKDVRWTNGGDTLKTGAGKSPYQTNASHPGQDTGAGPADPVQVLLTEKKVELVIVSLCGVRDLLDLNEYGLCRRKHVSCAILSHFPSGSSPLFLASTHH